MATAVEVGRRRRDLLRRSAKAPDTDGVFREAARSLRRLVDFDAIALVGTDPTSGLPTCPIQTEGVEGMTAALCSDHWEREFVVTADVARFRDLYRAENPAASLPPRSTIRPKARGSRRSCAGWTSTTSCGWCAGPTTSPGR